MDGAMLIALALVDSLSAGTLVIPIVLLLSWQHLRVRDYAVYLATIALSYGALGIALLLGVSWIATVSATLDNSTWFSWVLLVLGAALMLAGIVLPDPKKRTTEEVMAERTSAKRRRLAGPVAMIALAFGAAVVEAATMLPYLAAVGIIHDSGWPFTTQLVILGGYCLIMIAPAIAVGMAFHVYGERVMARITRLIPRLEYEAKVTVLWVMAVVGFYVVGTAVSDLGLLG